MRSRKTERGTKKRFAQVYLGVRKTEWVGCLPTQMTSEFHPLSKIQKRAVTTKTGCQGDSLYLSIKGTPCEDHSDLEKISNASAVGSLESKWTKHSTKQKNHGALTTTRRIQRAANGTSLRCNHRDRHTYWNKLTSLQYEEKSEAEKQTCSDNHGWVIW